MEVWESQGALDALMVHPHAQEFLSRSAGLLDGTPEMALHDVPDPA